MFQALSDSAFADFITGLSPQHKLIFETIHIMAGIFGIGALMVINFRLLGFSKTIPVAALARPVFIMAWTAFGILFLAGVAQFVPIAGRVSEYWWFQTKMLMVLLAFTNLIWLHVNIRRHAGAWDTGGAIPISVRNMAILSIVLWPTITIFARMMFAFLQATGVNSR